MKRRKQRSGPEQIIENLQVLEMVAEGKCLARHEGQVVFIEGAAPGDVVDVRVFRHKKNFLEGQPVRFHSYSPQRTTPFCEHFGTCGGCKWQHLDYDAQLQFKHKQVQDSLERIGGLELPPLRPILASEQTTYYRNKLEYTFADRRWLTAEQVQSGLAVERKGLGFHIPGRFDKILDIRHCYLQPDPSNAIRLEIRRYALERGLEFNDPVKQRGFLRNLIIRTANSGDVMVIVQLFHDDEGERPALLAHLQATFPEITSLHYVINNKGNETFHDLEVHCVHGEPFITERMEDLQFRIGPKSFYQTNAEQAYLLYRVAREMAALGGQELVYDLYTGTGTIANFVARQARRVVGLEYVEMAVADARINSQINGITNTEFYAGDMKKLLTAGFPAQHGHPDVVITDPPRAGMDPEVVEMLRQMAPQRIVYVSCNPATQARDLALLNDAYRVTAVQPVDMFPHTHHVENVVALEKR